MKYLIRTFIAIVVFFVFILINGLVNKLPDFFLWNIPIMFFNWCLPTLCILYYFSIAANGVLSTLIGIVLSAGIIFLQINMINVSQGLTSLGKIIWYCSVLLAILQAGKCISGNIKRRFITEDF